MSNVHEVPAELAAQAALTADDSERLRAEVGRFANVLRHLGVIEGDRIGIYLPMIPEAAVAMRACTRIGAVPSLMLRQVSPDALAERIARTQCKLVITADEGTDAGERIAFKAKVDEALTRPGTSSVETVIVVRCSAGLIYFQSPRDRWYHDLIDGQSTDGLALAMRAEDR